MIRFACPACQKVLKAPDEGAGRKTHCPRCGQRLLIPPPIQVQNKTLLGQPMPESAAALPIPPSDWLKDVRAAEEKSRVPSPPKASALTVFCPHCHARLLVDDAQADGEVECPQCGGQFAVGVGNSATFDPPATTASQLATPPTPRKARRRNLVIATTIVLLLTCLGVGGIGLILHRVWRERTPTTQEMKTRLLGFTAEEVRRELGEPSEKIDIPAGVQGGITTALEFQRELQIAALQSSSEPEEQRWVYHRKTRDARTGELDPTLNVWFRFSRVVHVSTP